MGNLTRDPDVRYTPKGTAVAEISLAINRRWNDDAGQKQEETTFVECTLWGRQAEIAGQYLKKGRPLFVEGRLHLDTWDDKQSGQKRNVGESEESLRRHVRTDGRKRSGSGMTKWGMN